jgi:hypothetical protein
MEAMFLSILVEQQKEINSLREALSNNGRTITSNASKEQLPEESPIYLTGSPIETE